MMISNFSRFKRFIAVVSLFAAAFFLFAQQTIACSWDYLIWQNRSKNADPYYRFVENDKAGFIDQSGKVFVEPKFRVSGNYQSGIINGLLETSFLDNYIDVKTGKEVSEEFYRQNTEMYFDGLIVKRFEGRYGFVDNKNNTIIEPSFIYARNFSEGFAPVIVEGPCIYENLENPCSDETVFPIGNKSQPTIVCKFNFIDKKGNLVSSQTFFDIKEFSEGLAPVKTEKGWGYINTKGKIVVAPQFDEANPFSGGLALVRINELYGYINSTGAFIIEPQFNSAGDFSDGLAAVGNYEDKTIDNKFYYINKSGKPVTKETFLLASHYFKGIAHVLVSETLRNETKGDKEIKIRKRTYAYINNKGKMIFTYAVEEQM